MLDFQGSKIKLENLPVTLRYLCKQVYKPIYAPEEAIQSTKAAWESIYLCHSVDITTRGAGYKACKKPPTSGSLMEHGIPFNLPYTDDPIISEFLAPIKKNVAGGFDIDHIIPPRFWSEQTINLIYGTDYKRIPHAGKQLSHLV